MKSKVYLPPQFLINRKLFGNPVFQLLQPQWEGEAEISDVSIKRSRGKLIKRGNKTEIVVLRAKKIVSPRYEVILSPKAEIPGDTQRFNALRERFHWLRPEVNKIDITNTDTMQKYSAAIRDSWKNQFAFVEEERQGGTVIKQGLRSAQIGALHATLGYWKTSNKPATVVMPTGTGKTETMLSLLVNQRIEKLLVVVPTDALRTQIAQKFITLGLLKQIGVLGNDASNPVVGVLEHRFSNIRETEQYFNSCNVIVTTMSILNGLDDNIQKRIAEICSHLFIDEAHHISAPTWEKFRRHFIKRTILQFTATPYRSDGRHVDGKVIFNFPLKKAQEEGYFKQINFTPIREYNPQKYDSAIAKAATNQLDKDLEKNLDHLIMARVDSIDRAKEVHDLYKQIASKYKPVIVHSKQTNSEKNAALQQLKDKDSRIVVCVDMFGEGFDLPELKIAALHDMHKSLAITIQFTGRFTRTKEEIGDATVIANVAKKEVEDALRELYTEDADWNVILRNLSEGATGGQEKRSDFLEGFMDLPTEIPIQNLLPKMSTVVYKTQGNNWQPEKLRNVIKQSTVFAGPTINNKHNVAVVITCIRESIDWANLKDVYNTIWDLYILHWNAKQKLLYINSSNKSYHEGIAKAVAGDDVELIKGEQVFRTLSGINRLMLMNLGLKSPLSRAARFTMHVGSDIKAGLPDALVQNKIKSNLFGRGFENGQKSSIGCSNKGRIWAYKVAHSIPEWIEWCEDVGKKLLDTSIKVEEILDNAMVPEPISSRPALVPLAIEWAEETLLRSEEIIQLDVDGEIVPFYEAGMELTEYTKEDPIKFKVYTENKSVPYEIKIQNGKIEYLPTENKSVVVKVGKKQMSLSEWFQTEPPTIRFEDGAFLIYNEMYKLKQTSHTPFDKEKIEQWDWTGVNLREESQTKTKNQNSIQYKVIKKLLEDSHDPQYDVVFDDDDAYEAADIVGLKVIGDKLLIHFYHCKYAKDGRTSTRIDNLYEVCGQAQKSVFWKGEIRKLIHHMRKREITRINKSEPSRFEQGDMLTLDEIENKLSFLIPELTVSVVQPGISKATVENDQLSLLAVTELYLYDTYAVALRVIAST